MNLPPPMSNGRYLLQKMLGEGGMASVYVALDQVLAVHRAIKVLSPRLCENSRIRQRFIDEARAMARMKHPNIVTVHDVGVEGGQQPYIIMELVQGGSVGDLIKFGGAQEPGIAGTIMIEMLKGLQCAHDSGIIHRDIKPDNVLLTRGGIAKITDFGIAHIEATDHSMTRTGTVLGTIAYMSPEQRRDSKSVTLKADLYAAGAMFFALLKGTDPFDLYAKELQESLLEDLPDSLCTIICKACSFNPEERYESAEEMGQAIHDVLDGMGIALSADGSIELPSKMIELSGGWNAESDASEVAMGDPDFSNTSSIEKMISNFDGSEEGAKPSSPMVQRFVFAAIVLLGLGLYAWFSLKTTEPKSFCGDGVINEEEICDDGNQIATDTCTNDCSLNVVFMHGGSPSNEMWKMGSETLYSERADAIVEMPATPLLLHPFWIDKNEVTREAFVHWAKSEGGGEKLVPSTWSTEQPGVKNLPANHVSHETARKYCQSLGGDTPTEGHWEYAARSRGKDIQYPWGDEEPSCELAILGRADCSFGRAHPVCSRPKGNTEQGLCDMAGNVWEWTRNLFPHAEEDDYPRYAGLPKDVKHFPVLEREIDRGFWEMGLGVALEEFQSTRINTIRGGGHWMTIPFYNRTRARYFIPKGQTESNIGFRCMYPPGRFLLKSMNTEVTPTP